MLRYKIFIWQKMESKSVHNFDNSRQMQQVFNHANCDLQNDTL